MNKAAFERTLKAAASGRSLKEIEFKDLGNGDVFVIQGTTFDTETQTVYVVGRRKNE